MFAGWPGLRLRAFVALALLATTVPAAAVTLTRGPYLQQLTVRFVTIVWNTDGPASCSVEIRPLASTSATLATGGEGTVCAVPVDGLAPGTEYAYRPLADGSPLGPEWTFHTDHPTRAYPFLVLGDSGVGRSSQRTIASLMAKSDPDFILHTGDMVYPMAVAKDWNPKFFRPYADLVARLVLWPCLGNHDVKDGGASWRDVFHTPANNRDGSEDYYSFDYGNAHVVVLNSDARSSLAPGRAQYVFLDQDLAASTATWKFVVFHRTIYSSGKPSHTSLRADLVPLFDAHAVDVVFMGHSHDYERTLPLRAGRVVDAGQGTVYVTTGGGGGSLESVGRSRFTAYSESRHHFVRVSIAGETLLLDMVRHDGIVRDTMTLVKETGRCPEGIDCDDGIACSMPPCPPVTSTTTTTLPPPGPVARVVADVTVLAAEPTTNHGGTTLLHVDGTPAERAFLRIHVSGVGERGVARAVLSLEVADQPYAQSSAGGRIRSVTDCSWDESTTTWETQPVVDGGVLDAAATVGRGERVRFDVTAAIRGDGIYCFALESTSSDGVDYVSREAPAGGPTVELAVLDPTCGDGRVNVADEECDGPDDRACPGLCRSDCSCGEPPPVAVVDADATVTAAEPATNRGHDPVLQVDGAPARRSFLRIRVSGVGGRRVVSARLRLQVADQPSAESQAAGGIRRVADCDWEESSIAWETQPAMDQETLDVAGAVARGDVVELDVTAAVPGDGTYCFAVDSTSSDRVDYVAREGSVGTPALRVDVEP